MVQRTPPELTQAARSLRKDATPAERILWQQLRQQQPRFTRQLVVDRYILDFACRGARIGIELDGGHHAFQVAADSARTRYLEARGWTMLRFWNNEVLSNPDGVTQAILAAVAGAATHPQPLPYREGSCSRAASDDVATSAPTPARPRSTSP